MLSIHSSAYQVHWDSAWPVWYANSYSGRVAFLVLFLTYLKIEKIKVANRKRTFKLKYHTTFKLVIEICRLSLSNRSSHIQTDVITHLWPTLPKIYFSTVGGITHICFKSLKMHTQGCHWCQKTRNFVRNSKILITRSTIQPKWSKIKNNLPFFKEFWWIS